MEVDETEEGGWCTIGEDVSGRPCFAIGAVSVSLDLDQGGGE